MKGKNKTRSNQGPQKEKVVIFATPPPAGTQTLRMVKAHKVRRSN